MIVVFLGAPGTGKGVQARLLCEKLDLVQVSTGEMLREEIKNNSEIGRVASTYLEKGDLVPCEIINELIEKFMENSPRKGGFIFDGFPRTVHQAISFDNLLKSVGKSLDFVLYFQTSRESLIKRLVSRRICSKCGKDYNLITSPSKSGVCDVCQGVIVQRDDDKVEVITRRMEVYENQTAPLMAHYQGQNKLHLIDCDREIQTIYNEISPLFETKAESKS